MSVLVLMKAVAPSTPEGFEVWHFDVVAEGGRSRTCEAMYHERVPEAKRRRAIVEWVARERCAEMKDVRLEEEGMVTGGLTVAGPVAVREEVAGG